MYGLSAGQKKRVALVERSPLGYVRVWIRARVRVGLRVRVRVEVRVRLRVEIKNPSEHLPSEHLTVRFFFFFFKYLAKISTHSTSWQFQTIKLIQKPIKCLHLTPCSKLMVPISILKSRNLK